ncbi:MAG: bifunctional riboflavin kinase/FMN adenylyltransferase [Acidimicrobiaceae bacterium]|nr:bifunctional riboflavin kinase/FMN adenylyltransferase [Acidimicrobiaceae bacterium]
MEVSRNYEKIQKAKLGSAVTIGTYDGVHLGHRKLISELCKIAHSRDLCSVVLTFEPHPASVVRPESTPLLLTGLEQKLEQLEKTGVELVQIIEFDEKRAEESAEEFVKEVLVETLNAKVVAVGEDFHFGKNREGNVKLLEQIGKEENFEIHSLELLGINETLPTSENQISSTAIREALLNGDLEKANMMLGRPYEVRGHVTEGDSRGRELGFPTANIRVPSERLLPLDGVYAGFYESSDGCKYPSAISLGTRPHFYNDGDLLLEVHLIDENLDLYGDFSKITFEKFLRNQKRFENIDSLIKQLEFDVDDARIALS